MNIVKVDYDYVKNNWINIKKIIQIYFPNCNIYKYKKKENDFFSIIFNDDIVGFFNIYKNNRIEKFCILPQFRKQNIGSNTIPIIIEYLKKNNQKTIKLFVKKNNIPAINFWKKNNFIITKEHTCIIQMEKNIL